MSDAERFKQERDNLFYAVVELEMILEEQMGRLPTIDFAIRKAFKRMADENGMPCTEREALLRHDASFLPTPAPTPTEAPDA